MEQPDSVLRFHSPIWVSVTDREEGGIPDCLYDEAAQYAGDIDRALREFLARPGNSILARFALPEDPEAEASIRAKVRSAHLSAKAIGSDLCAELALELDGSLTGEELDSFLSQIEEQCRNGLGTEFELLEIPTAQGDVIFARLGNDDLGFYAADEEPTLEQTL